MGGDNFCSDSQDVTSNMPTSRDVACQTDKKTCSVGTQLSLKTLGASYRSAGMQPPSLGYIFLVKIHPMILQSVIS